MTDLRGYGRLTLDGTTARLEHNMNKREKLADLRHSLAQYGLPPDRPPLGLGVAGMDAALGGGLMPGALHEIHAGNWGAGGFAACLAIKAAGRKPLFWVRPDYEALEYGQISPLGLMELGGDPANLFVLRAPNATEALAAGADILACPHVGALVLELNGHPKALDLVASRRLAFAAAESGVTVFLLREGAAEMPNAALTRWRVTAAPSEGDDDWGAPAFTAALTRNRLGPAGCWTVSWDIDHGLFRQTRRDQQAPHPGSLAAAPSHRPDSAAHRIAV